MSITVWVAAVLATVVLYPWYATIVKRRNRVAEALAGIDVQLTQRHDLIPNLLAIARKYMEHERGLLDEIASLRSKAASFGGTTDVAAAAGKFAAEKDLTAGLGRLFAVAENYPTLKSDGPMIEAQRGYQEVETNIAAARRFYNAAVGGLNNAIQIFPGPLLARLAGVAAPPPFFEATAAARAAVDAGQFLQ
jgi:LemA protein